MVSFTVWIKSYNRKQAAEAKNKQTTQSPAARISPDRAPNNQTQSPEDEKNSVAG